MSAIINAAHRNAVTFNATVVLLMAIITGYTFPFAAKNKKKTFCKPVETGKCLHSCTTKTILRPKDILNCISKVKYLRSQKGETHLHSF